MVHRTGFRSLALLAAVTLLALVATPRVVHVQAAATPPQGGGQGRAEVGAAASAASARRRRRRATTTTRASRRSSTGRRSPTGTARRDVWSIVDGLLHADTTKTPGQHHIHYTGPGAVMRDFTLKVEVKLSATGANGGIQYRSRLLHPAHGGSIADPLGKPLPANITTMAQAVAAGITAAPAPRGGGRARRWRGGNAPVRGNARRRQCAGRRTRTCRWRRARRRGVLPRRPRRTLRRRSRQSRRRLPPAGRGSAPARATGNPWQVSGYQFDLDSANQYTGQLYEGQGRNIITAPGTIGMLLPGNCKILLGKLPGDAKAAIKPHQGLDGEWQQIEIIVRGNTMIHMINGQVMSITVDDDPVARAPQGILSLQLEGSGQIWYRNVYLKQQDKSLDFPR